MLRGQRTSTFVAQERWNEQQMKEKLAFSTMGQKDQGTSTTTGQNMTCMSTNKQYFSSLFVVCNLHEIRIRLTREVSSTQYIPLGKRMHTFFSP